LIALRLAFSARTGAALGADALMTWPSHRLMIGAMWQSPQERPRRSRSFGGGWTGADDGHRANTEALDREIARRDWTSRDLARAAGLWEATISTARSGKRISPQTLRMIAVALTKAAPVSAIGSLLL